MTVWLAALTVPPSPVELAEPVAVAKTAKTAELPGIGKQQRCDAAPRRAGWLFQAERARPQIWSLEKRLSAKSPPRAAVISFFATWCKPCRAGLPRLARLAAKHPDVAFVLVVVPPFEPGLQGFLDPLNLQLPVIHDRFGALWDAWAKSPSGGAAPALPRTIIVDGIPRITAILGQEGADFEVAVSRHLGVVDTACTPQ
jgi:thiol-disulfide isomerase/thioredoxin